MDKMNKMLTGHPWSSLKTITTFDEGEELIVSDDVKKKTVNRRKSYQHNAHIIGLLKAKASTPISLLVQSLVQQLCGLLEPDDIKATKLYNVICEKLFEMQLIDESYSMGEFELMRSQYQKALYQLVSATRGGPEYNINSINYPSQLPQNNSGLEWSRYEREFIEMEYLAGGGFGKVFKVKNRLDDNVYAVKKIIIKSGNIKSVVNRLTEVKTFACLNHANIVSYKSAWLEPYMYRQTHNTINGVSQHFEESYDTSYDLDVINNSSVEESSTQSSEDSFIQFKENSFTETSPDTFIESSELIVKSKKKICKFSEARFDNIVFKKPKIEWATLYIQMSLCDLTLKQWLEKRNREENIKMLSEKKSVERYNTIINIFQQLVKGVQYIHSKGIIHHDVKPTNVFVAMESGSMTVQLGDFGLACAFPKNHHENPGGTKLYAAPEQLNGRCNIKNDVFSLGIILLELIESFDTDMERIKQIEELRKGKLSLYISARYPQIAKVISQLITTDVNARPNASEILTFPLSMHENFEIVRELRQQIKDKDSEIERLRAKLLAAGIE